MGKYGEIQEDFLTERNRILGALAQPENKKLTMRVIGALAFRYHCEKYGYIQDALGRVFTDIDFAGYSKQFKDIMRLLPELGYKEDKVVTQLFGDYRLLFHDPVYGRHIDVFMDKLDFCHILPFTGRLEADTITLPLAELIVEKMQIVQINEKDIIDTIMLLREHPIGDSDDETVNAAIIAKLAAKDWGLWKTMSNNLNLVKEMLARYTQLTDEDRQVISTRVDELLKRMDDEPKALAWKARAVIGEKKKWWKDVEELENR
jgi:hypothetical protein